MAILEYQGKTYTDELKVKTLLAEHGIPFERWGLRGRPIRDDEVLAVYEADVARLKQERGYAAVDMVALANSTPNLDSLLAIFDKEHHHTDDEVRFTVEGEGIFEIETLPGEFAKVTTMPGDLIIIPAYRRHLFYLTAAKKIRCIRLFRNQDGWKAIYEKSA